MLEQIDRDTPVLVVGAGPVGLALAGDLGRRGMRSVIVDRRDGSIFQPKMDMVGIRTMEFCRRWGITAAVESAGYNRDYTQDCAWITDLNGIEFGREEFPPPKDEPVPPQSPAHRERCPQNFFDPVLRSFATQTGNVDFRYETELVGFEDRGDRVIATLRPNGAAETYELEASYLVGCDGADSTVRETLGIDMHGVGTLTYTTNAVFRTANLEELHTTPPAYRYILIGPEGTWATLVAINGRDEWRFSLVGDAVKAEASTEDMRRAIIRAVGREFDFEILSILPWERRQLVADSYRKGRVFLAGDAAHLTSPTGGFGMNTGILDAVNLSWKLVACREGWGGEELLESYELEQLPVAERNVAEATGNLRRMLSPRLTNPDLAIFDKSDMSPETRAARKRFGDDYSAMMSREWNTIGIHLGYVYENSPTIIADGTPAPPDEVSTYVQTARPGSRAPHAWLDPDETRSLIDEFGDGFVLLRFDRSVSTNGFQDVARDLHIPLRVLDVDNPDIAALYERALVLVRPDGQVCWRADQAEHPEAVLRQVTGWGIAASSARREPDPDLVSHS